MGKVYPFAHFPQDHKKTGIRSRKAHKKLCQTDRRRSRGEYHIGIEAGGHLFVHENQKHHTAPKRKQYRHAPGLSGKPESECQVETAIKQTVSHGDKLWCVPPDELLDLHRRPLGKIPVVTDASKHKQHTGQHQQLPHAQSCPVTGPDQKDRHCQRRKIPQLGNGAREKEGMDICLHGLRNTGCTMIPVEDINGPVDHAPEQIQLHNAPDITSCHRPSALFVGIRDLAKQQKTGNDEEHRNCQIRKPAADHQAPAALWRIKYLDHMPCGHQDCHDKFQQIQAAVLFFFIHSPLTPNSGMSPPCTAYGSCIW